MARARKQDHSLGPLQRRILLHLATKGSKNINETAKEMKAHYKSVHTAFYSLEEKEMIVPVGKMSYRGQNYDTFWLTGNGILKAMLEGADPNLILKVIKKTFPRYDDTVLFTQIVSRMPKKMLRITSALYPSISSQVGVQEILKLVFMTDLNVDDLRRLYDILKESPFKEIANETIKKASAKFEELKKAISAKS
jgi:hypothetical protein